MATATRTRPQTLAAAARSAAEVLEPRRLFAATVVGPITPASGTLGGTSAVDLGQFFNDPAFELVRFTTPQGDFRVRLVETQKPITVANFMRYVKDRDASGNLLQRYNGTFIHRSDPLTPNAPITTPPDIIQGGGYAFPGFEHIETLPPIQNEFTTNGTISNTRGTIAMAKTSDPNSATSEWFINLDDNSVALDSPSNSGGFTVFGRVLDEDLPVVDAIAAVPRFPFQSPFSAIPLRNYTQANFDAQVVPTADNVVGLTATELADLTYTVTSSDPAIATAAVDPATGLLTLTYGQTRGQAQITVTATDEGGQSVQQSFTANAGGITVQVGGTSGNRSVAYTDADGTITTISLKGAGAADVQFLGGDLAQSASRGRVTVTGTGGASVNGIAVTGTDASTTVTIASRGGTDGATTLTSLTADGAVKAISAKGTQLNGTLTVGGSTGAVTLAGATGSTITLGGAAADRGTVLSLGTLADTDVSVAAPIRSLKLTTAGGTDATADVITAPSILAASTSGDLAADVAVTGEGNLRSLKVGGNLTGDVSAHQIGAISVRGDITGGTITARHGASETTAPDARANQGVQAIKVSGAMTDAVIDSAGTIGSLSAGSTARGRIVAGAPGLTTLPATLAELPQAASILSLRVRGTSSGTVVAARNLGKVSVNSLQTTNAGTPFGFAADRIASLVFRTEAGTAGRLRNIEDQAAADAALTGVTPNDAVIRVF